MTKYFKITVHVGGEWDYNSNNEEVFFEHSHEVVSEEVVELDVVPQNSSEWLENGDRCDVYFVPVDEYYINQLAIDFEEYLRDKFVSSFVGPLKDYSSDLPF